MLCMSFALAAPLNPTTYWGYVKINGENAPRETELTVITENGEQLAQQLLPIDEDHPGSYSMILNLDDPYTEEDEGGVEGESLTWYVDGIRTLEPNQLETTLEEGAINNDFTITGIRNPELKASFAHASKTVIGENVNITMLLQNQGEGTATIDWTMQSENQNITQTGLELEAEQKITKSLVITPKTCGEYETKAEITYFNQVKDYIGTINSILKFEVTGPDLSIQSMEAQRYTTEQGTTIPFSIVIQNLGEEEAGQFSIEIYELTGEKEAKIDKIEVRGAVTQGDMITATYDYDTTRKTTNTTHKIRAQIIAEKTECNQENNNVTSKPITITPKPELVMQELETQEIIDEKAQEQIEQTRQQEHSIDDGTPVGYMVLPGFQGEQGPLDKILVIALIILIAGNLIFFTIYKGNLKIIVQKPKKEDESDEKISFEPQHNTSVEKIKSAETIDIAPKPIWAMPFSKKEKSEEQKRQEEIREEIDNAIAEVQKPKKTDIKPKQDNTQTIQKITLKQETRKKEDEQQKILEEAKTKSKIIGLLEKEKSKDKRNELFKDKIAAARNKLANRDIKENVLMQKGDEKKGSFLPYEYLKDASRIVSYIHNNQTPRTEIIDKLGKKYPLFLVDLGIRAVHSSKSFEYSYSKRNFDHVQPDTQNYAYVTYWNIVKSVKMMAEKLSLERKEQYNNEEVKSILFNKWNKDQPLVAFLYKEMF